MNLAEIAINNKITTLVLTIVTIAGGILAYQSLGRLEDPEFTIKDALIITPYPGASAAEVEEEVTDRIEKAVQKLGQLKEVKESLSYRGRSVVTATIKDKYDKNGLPQVWDELRRKINDVQSSLPPGAGPSIVNDDFGDVYGVYVAIYGEEYSAAELKKVVDLLRKELALVEDVAKVETFGIQKEVIYVELDRDRLSQLGIQPELIAQELRQKNLVVDAGRVKVGQEFITIDPTGIIDSVEDFESLLISGKSGDRQIYLRDVADIRRGYEDPPKLLLRYDGKPALGLGISTVPDGNVVTMGEALAQRLEELKGQIPLGVHIGVISMQPTAVVQAIDSFIGSLVQAVVIVIIVLLFFMGLRSGVLIGFILLLTICGTFIFMAFYGITLERISLGALIIALGMLVDNAIVVVDGMLVRIQKGMDRKQAAYEVVKQTAWPLLGATVVAVLAFAAIGTSQDSTGEYTRSLFQVILISLMFSWVTAVTVTPLLATMFLKVPQAGDTEREPYGGWAYTAYQSLLRLCIRRRWITVGGVVMLFLVSVWAFRFVPEGFFPNSTRPQFMVDYWLPQGTHIDTTLKDVNEIERYLKGLEGVKNVVSTVGQGSLRFILTYSPEKENSAYAQFLVDVDDYRHIDKLSKEVQAYLSSHYPHSVPNVKKFLLGPNEGGRIQARIIGPDPDVLRRLADEVVAVIEQDGGARAVWTNWRQRVKLIRPIIAEEQANLNGITRPMIADALRQGFEGVQVGIYREADELLPIIMRAPEPERLDVSSIQNLQIWSPAAQRAIPIRQVILGFETVFEDEIIMRKDRKRTIIVHADQKSGAASILQKRVMPKIEAIDMPQDYVLEWGGEYEDSADAQSAIVKTLPYFVLMMVLVVVGLFNALRQPLIIWLTVPLAIIGVAMGLLVTQNPFDFMALLGFMSLMGMLIKNAIVLIDEINFQISEGKEMYFAIVDSGVSRLRPVAMAALTTALGMIPLLPDVFFVAMAVTVIAGLLFATVLTMVVVPVLYAIFFKVREAA